MKIIKQFVLLMICCLAITPAVASDFDGSKSLICATIEARDCVLGTTCYAAPPRKIGAPSFIRIDFAKKTIIGPERTTSIASMEKKRKPIADARY